MSNVFSASPHAARRSAVYLFTFTALAAAASASVHCTPGKTPELPNAAKTSCGGLQDAECTRAKGLLAAATSYGNVNHEFLLDTTSAMAPGRGIQKLPGGVYSPVPLECAHPKNAAAGDAPPKTEQLDFTYIGLSIDNALVSAETDLLPFLSAGASGSTHSVKLIALAFVQDRDPQFFEGTGALTAEGESCQCGRASHFVGSVKYGGMLAYETSVTTGEVHAKALEFIQAKLQTNSTDLRQISTGGLEVIGLEEALSGKSKAPLQFRVKSPVPVAYAVYPVTDVCKFAFPAPEVSPAILDFGEVPSGRTARKLLHVQNRANIDVRALYKDQTFALPAQGSIDIPVSLTPTAENIGCETTSQEEALTFLPASKDAPVSPKQQSARIVERVTTGKATLLKRESVDTGEARRPDYAATARQIACPRDYVLQACRAEKPECGDKKNCASSDYRVTAEESNGACKFACSGPTSVITGGNYCRFEAVAECRLRCATSAPAAP
jgi:hypothetical protein